MSTITIVTCDRCGERVESGRTRLAVECGRLRDRWLNVDLCPACASAFEALMVGGEGGEEARDGEEDD